MRKLTRFLAIFLAVLMTVSVLPVSVFAVEVIDTVDTKLVTETVFPDTVSIANPVFYPELTVNGGETVAVDWVCIDEGGYKNQVTGTYHFQAVPKDSGYQFADGVAPVITVKVVAATLGNASGKLAFAPTADNNPIPYVVKGVSGKNVAYDATGFNALDVSRSTGAEYLAGSHNSVSGAKATIGATKITVTDGANIAAVLGGGYGGTKTHTGSVNIYINNATITNVFGGGYGANATVNGNSYIDVSGYVDIGTIYGTGSHSSKVNGTTTVNIHDLDAESTVEEIKRSSATNLVVKLDDTSKYLLSDGKITGVTTAGYTDTNVEVCINGEEFVGMTSLPANLDVPESIIKDTASEVLPTVEGFTWTYDDSTVGNKVFVLTADEGYFLDGLVKSKSFNVTVTHGNVAVEGVTIDRDTVTLREGETVTLTATVEPEDATDKTVMWKSDNTGIATVVDGVVTAEGAGTTTITATAGAFSDTCEITVSAPGVITAVDTEGLVLNTSFPYSDKTNAEGRWSNTLTSYVEEPTFYPELSVLVEGEAEYKNVPATWVCTTTYDGTSVGETYTFVPKVAGYEFAQDAIPEITVTIVDAGWGVYLGGTDYSMEGFALPATTENEASEPIAFVIKNDETYDATGCNKLVWNYEFTTRKNAYFYGAHNSNSTGIAGKTAATKSEGNVKVSVEDSHKITHLYGGTYGGTGHTGNVDITVKDSTLTNVYGAGRATAMMGDVNIVISGTSTVKGIYAAGWGANADVTGNANIDVSGKITTNMIKGGGYLDGASLSGVTTVRIHDLEEGWSIGAISKGDANELVIDVDSKETADEIFPLVTDWTNVTAKINGVEVPVLSEVDIEKTEYTVANGTELGTIGLPTSFTVGGQTVDGFTWEGTYNSTEAGDYVLTLKAPEGVYLPVDVAVTVTVEKSVSFYINSVTTETARVFVDYQTALEDVKALLPTEFTANDGAFTVPATAFEWVTEEYKANVPDEYTFKAVITDGAYKYTDTAEPFSAVVTVKAPEGEGIIVTEVKLPVNYTVFTKATGTVIIAGQNETLPVKFYDTLDAVAYENGVRKEIQITDVEWEGALTRTDADGEYWTYSIKSYDNTVSIAPEIIANATITAYKTTAEYANRNGHIRGVGNVVVPVTLVSADKIPGGVKGNVAIMDATGLNNVYEVITTSGAGTYYGGNTTDVTGNPSVTVENGAAAKAIYGGGNTKSVTGNGKITLKNGSTVTTDVYAGSRSADFIGDSTINIESGASVSGKVYATGMGKFDGDVVINVENGASIGGITLGDTQANYPDSLTINVTSGFDLNCIDCINSEIVKVYVDGVLYQKVADVQMPEKTVVNVALGTAENEVGLPSTLTATVNGREAEIDVTWTSENYDANTAGKYTFKPVVSDAYDVSVSNIEEIYVVVRVLTANAGQSTITGFAPINAISATLGTPEKDVVLPSTVMATVNGQSVPVEVDRWTCNGVYDGSVYGAEYTYTATVSGEYALTVSAPTVVVKITKGKIVQIYLPVTETTFPRGTVENPVFYDTLTVKFDNGTVADISGFKWSVKDYSKDTVGTYNATITTVPENCEFAASLSVPVIKVEVTNKKYDVFKTDDGIIYLYGIPTVIDGDANETYLYDITGCNKTDSANVSGKVVYGGGPANPAALKTTMVEMRGGNVGSIYGGSRNSSRITDTTYIYVYGGTVNYVNGGGSGSTTTATMAVTNNSYVYVENTTVTRICGAGYQGNVEGDATVIVKNSTVTAIYSSSTSTKTIMTVGKTAKIKLLDGATVQYIYGSGRASSVNELEIYLSKNAAVTKACNTTGMAYVTGTAKVFYETGFDLSNVYTQEENVKLYEGHFLEDRETFVTDREIKVIRNGGFVRGDVYVEKGTAIENIGLPTSVEGEIDGVTETVRGINYTPVKNYDGNKTGSYEFKLNLPDGYSVPPVTMSNAGKITVVVTEPAQSGNITSFVEEDTGYTLANGTVIENIGLPSAYTATVSGVSKTVPVKNWKVTDENGRTVTYDRYTAGTYVFTPEFDSVYTVSAEVPTHTVKLSAFTATRDANTVYLNGIPADINGMAGISLITDKNGNYLEYVGSSSVVYGGSLIGDVESTDITMNGGTLTAIYGGSNQKNIDGDVNIVINNGTITSLYAGSMKGTLDNSNVVINGGTVTNLYGINGGTAYGRLNYVVNNGTVSNVVLGSIAASGTVEGTKQTEEERLAEYTEKDKGPIVVAKDELISAVFTQNGGTVRTLYGGGKGADSTMNGSVKIYVNGGKLITICGGGSVQTAYTMENVYIVVSDEAECDNIYANAPGSIYGKSYVVVPDDFNRYNILGWNEFDGSSDDSDVDMDDDDAYLDEGYVSAEVIVSGGKYEEGIPVRILYAGTTQTVYASGVPIKIVGESVEDEEENVETSTYVWYFDENYDEETETSEIFSYETYVDVDGNQIELTGVWRRINEPLASGAVVYGGSMHGTTDKYPSTYVEFNGGTIKALYAGGKNNTTGTANVVLNAEGVYSTGSVYGGGNNNANTITHAVNIKVLRGSYDVIYAGGYNVTTNTVQVDVEGGNIDYIYMGSYGNAGVVSGTVTLNLAKCTVGTVYGGGYGEDSTTIGEAYINVGENVSISGYVYPKGSGNRPDKEKSGAVKKSAYVTLNDTQNVDKQFKKIKYTKSQAPYIYVNGIALGETIAISLATFETAEKKVEITSAESSDYRGNRPIVFLNGIPTVIAGDGNGHSYLYQAKTKDGTLNAYQKNEDGTFKYDENGKRISNIVRDQVTGQAIKGPKLVDLDVIDYVVYGGANGKSVEDVYVELQIGGSMWALYAGCRGGNAGYDAQGNEVGLVEVRQFGGGPFDELHMGGVLGFDVEGNQTVNVLTSKTVFLGINGGTRHTDLAGLAGTVGSEEKFIDGYYNEAGETVSYTDPDDNQTYQITGTWEDYNLDVTKEDYAEYYESTNARFNGEDNTDFLNSKFYVDPYDEHYTVYALLGAYSTNHLYFGTFGTEYDASRNRVYGNTYVRQSAYGLKYDAKLDMFVEDYNDYLGRFICLARIFDGSNTGVMYSDIRHDHEASLGTLQPLGRTENGAVNYGHTYINMYETDTTPLLKDELYKKTTVKVASNLTIKQNFFPKWSHTSAWALEVDENMPKLAIDKGYVTGVTDVKDVRTSMLGAEDGARLLNYYYTGSFDEFVTGENETESRGYQEVFDASDDAGKFVIRHFEGRLASEKGITRYLLRSSSHFGDSQLITFPNGETMLIDVGQNEPQTLIKDIRYVLEQYKEQGIGDGKTIDYFQITHPHGDHQANASAVLRAFDVKNVILPPYDSFNDPAYYAVIDHKSEQYVAEGKEPINIIRVQRGDSFTIGEGDEAVDVHVFNPGDHSYKTYTLAEMCRRIAQGIGSGLYNPCGIGMMFTFKGQKYYTAADIKEDAEQSLLKTYGEDFFKCDVMKLSHHGHASSSIYPLMNAATPDVTIQTALSMLHADASVPSYLANNNTGGYEESVFSTAVTGAVKVTMDGEKVTSVTQFRDYAYQCNTGEYKNLEASYEALLESVADTRESLAVVSDGATAPYGTAYIWNSYANYIDTQLEELSKRYYSGTMSIAMLESYTDKLEALEQFIEDATMYGGTDTTPDVEIPGTPDIDEGGSETTTPGTQGGIIGDIGGGDAGAGIGGGATVGGAGGAGGAGDVGETTDPVTPTPDDNRRFIDVAETDWFNKAVNYVADNNYFRGVSENEFDPYGKMTRAMLVTVIGRMAKADTSGAENNFTDVEAGVWYTGYVAWAAENGIVTGVGEGKFAPNDNVTREQIAAILMRYAATKGIETSVESTEKYDSMKDTDKVSGYAVDALKWATANGIINGAEGNINPKGNATRAEVAQMIMNFCNTFSI